MAFCRVNTPDTLGHGPLHPGRLLQVCAFTRPRSTQSSRRRTLVAMPAGIMHLLLASWLADFIATIRGVMLPYPSCSLTPPFPTHIILAEHHNGRAPRGSIVCSSTGGVTYCTFSAPPPGQEATPPTPLPRPSNGATAADYCTPSITTDDVIASKQVSRGAGWRRHSRQHGRHPRGLSRVPNGHW